MIAVASFFLILLVSLIVVRVAAVALTLTGMSRESARFQARSAWTGTGFTTAESEAVVAHPVRRQVITILMVVRGAGLLSAATALFFSFAGADPAATGWRIGLILLGVLIVWILSLSEWFDRRLTNIIRRILKRTTSIDTRDYATMFHLGGDYNISELMVREGDWLADRTLTELALPGEGVVVLGVKRSGGEYIGAPRGPFRILPGDTLIMYGRQQVLENLDERPAGLEGEAERYETMLEQQRQETEERKRAEQAAEQDEPETEQADEEARDDDRRAAEPVERSGTEER